MPQDQGLLGWVVCANVSDHLRGGTDPDKFYQGTKMFAPGTKLYAGQGYWGMAGECIHMIGLRRVSRDFVNCVVRVGVLENLRVQSIYSPKIWTMIDRLNGEAFADEPQALAYLAKVEAAHARWRDAKLQPDIKDGPWGPFQVDTYRPDKT